MFYVFSTRRHSSRVCACGPAGPRQRFFAIPQVSATLTQAAGTFIASFCEVSLTMQSANEQIKVVRYEYLKALLYQDIAFHDKNKAGDMASRLAEQSTTMVAGMGNKLGATCHHIGTFFGGIAVGFVFSAELSGVILAFFPGFMIAGALMQYAGDTFERRVADAYAAANAIASEAITSIKTVIAFSRERTEIQRYDSNLDEARKEGSMRSFVGGGAFGLFNFFMFCAYGVGCWYGAELIARDREDKPLKCDFLAIAASGGEIDFTTDECFTGGTVMSVFFGVLIGGFSVAQAAPNFADFAKARAAATKLFHVIDTVPAVNSTGESSGRKVDPKTFVGRIEFKNVTFRYPTRPEEVVLQGLNLVIEPGEQVALVGPSGSGKSTIIGILQRWYDVESGEVLIDGVNITEYDAVSLRAAMGLVLQTPILFDASVKDNVSFGVGGLQETDSASIVAACKAANAHDFIMEKDEQYNYQVGVRGQKLSGGQRQRVCIARAILRKPRILLADEATSALDNKSEKVVQASLDKLLADGSGRTTIVIAHRLTTIQNSNKIVVLEYGKKVEEGNHDELMAMEGGLYRKLYLLSQHSGEAEGASPTDSEESGAAGGTDVHTIVQVASTDEGPKATSAVSSVSMTREPSDSGAADKPAEDEGSAEPEETGCCGRKKVKSKEELEQEEKLKKYPAVSFWRVVREWQYPDFPLLALGILFACVNGAIFPGFALIFTEITTTMFELNTDRLRERAVDLLVLFIILAIVSGVGYVGQQTAFGIAGERLTKRLRAATFKAVMRQDATFFDHPDHTPGRLTARLSADAALVRATTGEAVGLMIQNIISLLVGIGLAFEASWRMTLVMLATIPLMILAAMLETAFFFDSGGAKDSGFNEAASVALEAVSAVRTVNAFSLQPRVLHMFKSAMDATDAVNNKRALVSGFAFGVSQGLMFLIYSLCFWAGTEFIAEGYINFEQLFKVFFVVTMASYGAGQASSMATDSSKAEPAKRSIFALIDSESGIDAVNPDGARFSTPQGLIEFKDVTFAYPSRPHMPVLKDFNLRVEPGQTVALVGPSGSGKSTVVALLQRQYDPQSGEVQVDGRDIKLYNPVDYRNQFGFVPQEPTLYHESIAYNVAYGRRVDASPDATPESMEVKGMKGDGSSPTDDVKSAVQSANALEFVSGFDEGFKTSCGQNGTGLSGGQKQRVAIARAIIRQPQFLLLDEATAALDNETERIVQESIDSLLADGASRTTVVIAHRLSTIQAADVICVVVDGSIQERGNHAELMAKGGLYAKLVEAGGHKGTSAIGTPGTAAAAAAEESKAAPEGEADA